MLIFGEEDLDEAAAFAHAAKARGSRFVEFEITAKVGFAKYVDLWENSIGQVVGQVFAEAEITPGMAAPRHVARLRVRCAIADVIAAQRRRAEREAREFGTVTR